MICLSDTRSGVSIATIVFYTCIWIPFKQMKLQILDIFSFIHHHRFCQPRKGSDDDVHEPTGLPAARFEEVASCSRDGGNGGGGCSICLAEYQREDMVSQLLRCRHVFHIHCIKSWLDRNQFTCPLCRDLFLHANAPRLAKNRQISLEESLFSFLFVGSQSGFYVEVFIRRKNAQGSRKRKQKLSSIS